MRGWAGTSKPCLDACFGGVDNGEKVFPCNPRGCLIFSEFCQKGCQFFQAKYQMNCLDLSNEVCKFNRPFLLVLAVSVHASKSSGQLVETLSEFSVLVATLCFILSINIVSIVISVRVSHF